MELALNEFIFHHMIDPKHSIDTIVLLSEIQRSCCKIVVNDEVKKKYAENLKGLLGIQEKYFHNCILLFLNQLLHNTEKVAERNYPNRLDDSELEEHPDAPFIKAALASSDKTLVTEDGRLKELLESKRLGLKVRTPTEASKYLRAFRVLQPED